MLFWDQTVEILRESIFAYAQVCHGNLGYGILVVTFLARLALLPLGIRLARAAQAHQRAMQGIQSELEALRLKYKGNARLLSEETQRVMRREGVSPFSLGGCLGALAQVPILVALYAAVRQAATMGGRFWWIRNLAKPDWFLAVLATAFTVAAAPAGFAGPSSNRSPLMFISAVVTLMALSKMAAGVGLYWSVSSLFGAAQAFVTRRTVHTAITARRATR